MPTAAKAASEAEGWAQEREQDSAGPKQTPVHPSVGPARDGISVTLGSESSPSIRWESAGWERMLRVPSAVGEGDFLFLPC